MEYVISAGVRPAVEQMFDTLRGLAEKGLEMSHRRELEESVLLGWRLAPDMFPLVAQFQLATEIPARGLARLAGVDVPSFANEETRFSELVERIEAARRGIAALADDALDLEPNAEITVPMGPRQETLTRAGFAQQFVLPNLYFHTTAAYLILRHLGLGVGKSDFLAASRS